MCLTPGGDKKKLKQNSWDSIRVWWAPILTRGKLHVELGEDFPGEGLEGAAATFVSKVCVALNIRFQNGTAPKILFVDRGPSVWATNSGRIKAEFKEALRENGLRTYHGDNAGQQPGSLQDFLLHETAVSWIRRRETLNRTTRPWEETAEHLAGRLKEAVQDINDTLDVEGLCRAFPRRLQKLVETRGERLPH